LTVTEINPRPGEDFAGLWRQIGGLTRAVTVFDIRFDRIDGDIAELKADVSELKADVSELKTDVTELKTDVTELKSDVGATKEQLNRLERATESRFNRVDAQLERLVTLIQRDEFKKS
jgi:chromosome segregation ATPase